MIDLHCDTIMKIIDMPDKGDLYSNPWQIDIQKLQKAKARIQDFALFVDLKGHESPYQRYLDMLAVYLDNLEKYKDYIEPIYSYANVERVYDNGKIGSLLSVEETGVFEGDLDKVRKAYEAGVRLMTISWNYPNGFSYPNGKDYEGQKLTNKGVELIELMQELGMIVDSSHLNDAGTWQLVDMMHKPFIASHSNARTLHSHPRNLPDELVAAIADKGGVIGLNFSTTFMGTNGFTHISDIVRHGMYLWDKGGSDVVAIGTDFDGIAPTTEIHDASEMPLLYDAFLAAGLKEAEVEKIFWKNADRLFKDIL